ncbi:siderophore-interacting protein [Solwaraspora sp. WMMD937]|uniref:siderophore-interacting protein n=1 Tax=Solwaraspora sp. WMMD937 TaxID=3016090 RepID=UPI00249B545A|nr:siderophore-interacting protein [Solwaraspora sp. WMMD937]WFE24353.1 siderophore-interacting protein [Solwaraspora sp. WMMD937]
MRRTRPADDEIDIEFALHGDSPMSSWARDAEPGTPAGIFDIGTRYRRPEQVDRQLLIGDESALPAVLSILSGTPPTLATEVYLEVPTRADIRSVETPAGVRVHWFSRTARTCDPALCRRTASTPGSRASPGWFSGHNDLINVNSAKQMRKIARCINAGRSCR